VTYGAGKPDDHDDPNAPLTRKERVDVAMDAWKKSVEVQTHFNDIEIRIRNLAITVVGAVFSVGGLLLKDNRTSNLPGAVVLLGGFLCLAFFFMDGGWYHRLLHGAVEHGRSLENYIKEQSDVPVGLANTIKEKSPLDMRLFKMRSDHKIIAFYLALFGVSVVFAVVLWISAAGARQREATAMRPPSVLRDSAKTSQTVPIAPSDSNALPPAASGVDTVQSSGTSPARGISQNPEKQPPRPKVPPSS